MFRAEYLFATFKPSLEGCISKSTPMRIHLVLWLFLIPFCLINLCTSVFLVTAGQCLSHQQSLLFHLKNNLLFNPAKSKKLVHWGHQSEDCCHWKGVTCNKGHVVALDLSEESISGGIDNSSSLFNLQYLQQLNMAFNDFHSVIPAELQKLKSLRYLNLSNAGFEGQVPAEISHLRRLVILDLSSSFASRHALKLEKPNIAMLLQNLTELTELYLDGVKILAKGKDWCHALSPLKNLQVLSMSSCNLSGPIDSSLAKLQSLSVIKLNQNNISSPVPNFFANFSNLTSLQLRSCGLSEVFPKDIFQIQTLEVLDISDNMDLLGSLPNFQHHGPLQTLNLSHTNFSGQLPASIFNLRQLSTLDLSNCQFNGTLPNSLSELTQLDHLDFSSNNFTGPLPSFNMSKNLTFLSVFHNGLRGEITLAHFRGLTKLVSIDLRYNSLYGNIPPYLFILPSLQDLELSYNQFDGQLDNFLEQSSSVLKTIGLNGNNLHGPIPSSFFSLKQLSILQLSSNKFNGTIKLDMIRRLKNLVTLDLSHNNLSVDASLKEDHLLSSYPKMTNLMLASCRLKEIPGFLRNQSTLLYLDLAGNEIPGILPNWIWRLDIMIHLNISNNFLTDMEGPFQNLSSNLFVLDLHSNQLQGPIPFFPKYAPYLDYSNNRFSSVIPVDIGNHLPSAFSLSLSNNSLHGKIHESFCNASSLRVLDLSHNSFIGMIPQCLIKKSDTFRVLNLGGNKISGNISDTIPPSCALRFLDLNGNFLGGTVPKSLVNCKKLQVLNIGNNLITDRFPCFLKSISTLRVLILRSNRFHGPINECPNSIGDWKMLQIVDVASNNFAGKLPGALLRTWKAMMLEGDQFGHLFFDVYDNFDPVHFEDTLAVINKDLGMKLAKLITIESPYVINHLFPDVYTPDLTRYQDSVTVINKGLQMKLVKILTVFTSLDFSSNHFEGPIPEEVMSFKALYVLNLSSNAFSGHIPSSWGNLKLLESLDLSNNLLSGKIPIEIASLSFLAFLNVSFNHLVGKIPTGTQIQSFDAKFFEGNKGLCGPPLTQNCSSDGVSPPTSETLDIDGESLIDWNFLSVELGFTFGFGLVILPLMFWNRWRLWYSQRVDDILYRIFPQLDFVYESRAGKKYRSLRWKPR